MGRWLKLVTMAALAALAIACGGGDDERPNTRAGRILSRTFLGSTVRYTALVDGQPWLIETADPAGSGLREGGVRVYVAPERVHLIGRTADG